MIIVGSERGSAKELAAHLLNDRDGNEHISVHELRGFVSENLENALEESYAISRGTKCKKHLFSVSFNPPADKYVSIEEFEDAIQRVEERNQLTDHPRAIVFHEKDGRRHAHAVWSRIDAETMTAKNLSHYKLKLQTVSREMYHEHDWQMPAGLARKGHGDPRNYTLAEYQQSKRMNVDPRDLKGAIQDAYNASDNAKAFAHALSERGFILAKGDRRGHVAVSHEGEVLSISRYVGKKAKEVREKLGEPDRLPSVDEAKTTMVLEMRNTFKRHAQEALNIWNVKNKTLEARKELLARDQRKARTELENKQKQRWLEETKARSARLNTGLRAVWQWVTGQRHKIQLRNIKEASEALERDQAERNALLKVQHNEMQALLEDVAELRTRQAQTFREIRQDRDGLSRTLNEERQKSMRKHRASRRNRQYQDNDWEPEI